MPLILFPVLLCALVVSWSPVNAFRLHLGVMQDQRHPRFLHSIASFDRFEYRLLRQRLQKPTRLNFRVKTEDELSETVKKPTKPLQRRITPPKPQQELKLSPENDEDDDEDEMEENKGLLKRLSKGLVPIAATLGFAITPSSNIFARLAGATAAGFAGYIAKKAMVEQLTNVPEEDSLDGNDDNNNSLPPGVAAAVKSLKGYDITEITAIQIESLMKKARISKDDQGALHTELLAAAMLDAALVSSMDLFKMSTVYYFALQNEFLQEEIADALTVACLRLGKQMKLDKRGFFAEEMEIEFFLPLAKLYFLGGKLLGSYDGFFGNKAKTALSFFPLDSYKEIITESSKQLFAHCVNAVLDSPSLISKQAMDELRSFLLASDEITSLKQADLLEIVTSGIDAKFKSVLSSENPDPMQVDLRHRYDSLMEAQPLLGFDRSQTLNIIRTYSLPVFEKAAGNLFQRVNDRPEVAAELAPVLIERVDALKISYDDVITVVTSEIIRYNSEYLKLVERIKDQSRGQLEPVLKIMVKYAQTFDAFRLMVGDVLDKSSLPLPRMPFDDETATTLYIKQKERSSAKTDVKDPESLESLFQLSNVEMEIIGRNMQLPKVISWVQLCLREKNYKPEAKAAYQGQLKKSRVTTEEWQPTATDYYVDEVKQLASRGGVPSIDDMQRLAEVRDFLDLKEESADRIHLQAFGDKYIKAVTEAMTPTGVIVEEYLEGLDRLRDRLMISVEDGKKLVALAIRKQVAPLIKDLADIWRSNTDAKFRAQKAKDGIADKSLKDKSGDPISSIDNRFGFVEFGAVNSGGEGPSVFMREALNLVEMVEGNFESLGADYSYDALPFTTTDVVEPATALSVMEYFMLTQLFEQDSSLLARYNQAAPLLANILGIAASDVAKTRESIAFKATRDTVARLLKTTEFIESQDFAQISLLKSKLGFTEAEASKIYDQAAFEEIMEYADTLFFKNRKTGQGMTPELARRFRQQV